MLSTGEEIRSPQRSSRSGPILAKMPCTSSALDAKKVRVQAPAVPPKVFTNIGPPFLCNCKNDCHF